MTSAPSTPKHGDSPNNCNLGKRKKSRSSKGSYLSKWLDKTMHHIEASPSLDYDCVPNWPNSSQFAPGYDPCRYNMYGCTPEPASLPTLPTYYNPPFYGPEYRYMHNKSVQVQRPRPRKRNDQKAEEVHSSNTTPNGTLNYLQPKNFMDSQDYTSLPPIITSVGDTNSTVDMNANEKDDGNRRYSDPCVRGLPDVARPANGDVDSASESSSDVSGSQVGSRLLTCLLDQITTLKMANERLNKDLMEMRTELDSYRQQAMFYPKGPSMGVSPNHSPLASNGVIGGQYSPGFLSDLVREIRDAARVREEAMYSRVRALVLERSENGLAPSEGKFTEKSLEDIKSSLRASEADKRRVMDRVARVEEELRTLRLTNGAAVDASNGTTITNGNIEEADSEKVRLRKEMADLRKAKQSAEDHALKLERLVTQLRSKFNGLQLTNGPESLPSDAGADHENMRVRRTSVNSSTNSTVVFGPVTDL